MDLTSEKLKIVIGEGVDTTKPIEVILREGAAPKAQEPLPIKEPESISLSGVIDMPLKWLEKRINTIDQNKANIKVDRENMTISLTINEDDYYSKNTLTGKIQISDTYSKFGINNDEKVWTPNQLGQFLRLNRGVFEDKEKALVLVSNLKNFTAKAKAEIQKQKDPSGSTAAVYKQQVESNLPKSFTVSLAIFKSTQKQSIEVEFDHHVVNGDVLLQLVSPGANELTNEYKDTCIDSVLEKISAIAPDIAILEV